ncbi:SGNH/GDSL hydrolase family protein [Pectobacterium aquaticum]|uniref:SGNH/GDSL hydrolase family protein n=1 Tax=Pectobacterium aquaticum TaxID=2204145 RepID=UPI001F0F6CE1|nr:SGNH/GDSL hydrolase family protein [Pectobacterium aquaticum]MCH5051210.1 SGNH/GDSL hydrolase family protein [Pectobacterium aquaticum]
MANLPESPQWTDGVYQIERNDPVGGGPDGAANKPLKDLANRTRWLYQKFNTAFDDLGWIQLGLWEIGLEISLPTQIVNYQGSWYRYAGNLDAPHVISGASPDEDGNWINVGDAALRSELLLPPSAIRAAAVTHTTPEMFNAVGNGVNDDSQAINTAVNVGESVFLKDDRKYLCPDYDNRYGTPLVGGGSIVEPVSGGMKKRNTYVDNNQRITGLENLARWYRALHDQLNTPSRPLTILFSGDSTTAGDGTISGYRIDELVKAGMLHEGTSPAFGLNVVNAGHSGAMTAHWADTYVDADIATNPDLYVLRWGINDPGYLRADGSAAPLDAGQQYPGRRTMRDFIDSLRKGLAKIRETHGFHDASILLMTPSSTWDIPNARDPMWYEQLRNAILHVARDYQCAFIDTYAIMQDVSSLANILMDDPFGDGRGIHPNSAMNPVIAGYIVDAISPHGIARKLARNAVISVGGAERPTLITDTGSAFNPGIHMSRTLLENDWPLDGSALTIRYPDEVMLQIISAYQVGASNYMYVRSGRAASLNGEAEGWNPMHVLCTSPEPIDVTTEAGYAIGLTPGTELKIARSGATVTFSTGFVEKITQNGSGIPAFTIICKVPHGYAPVREAAMGTAIVWDGVNGFESLPCRIRVSGDVELLKSTPFVTYRIYFSISYDLR